MRPYFTGPFRVWDGEGRTICSNRLRSLRICAQAEAAHPTTDCDEYIPKHAYIMLANSDGGILRNDEGLSTRACLEFLCDDRPFARNIWYAFTYDVNMILKDLNDKQLTKLWNEGAIWWNGFYIKYIPRKIFKVTSAHGTFHSTDIFTFFQTSFLKAAKDWGVDVSAIEAGKAARGNFQSWTFEQIREYNDVEMGCIRSLANRLEAVFVKADLVPSSWYGPGAVANVWLDRHNASDYFPVTIPYQAEYAYFGGRSDISLVGEVDCYKADLASAYPAAMARCIGLQDATWERAEVTINDEWGLYHVAWDTSGQLWNPFPWRADDGTILYPPRGEGWYWGIEVLSAESAYPNCIRRTSLLRPVGGVRKLPLAKPIYDDYALRRKYKQQGDDAARALKLALNSLYGKTCMAPILCKRENCKNETHPHEAGLPKNRNIVWGGWITAWTRAQIIDAMGAIGFGNVISVATDGMLTRVPIPNLDTTNELGCWQDEGYGTSLVVCPGLYAHFRDGVAQTYRQRGQPVALNYGYVLRSWGCATELNTPGVDACESSGDLFIGMGRYLKTHRDRNQFVSQTRALNSVPIFGTSKRQRSDETAYFENWQTLTLRPRAIPNDVSTMSAPYKPIETEDDIDG
jgi:hypothetical protein